MSRVERLLVTDRIFFVTVNLRKDRLPFTEGEFPKLVGALEESRRKLELKLFGYVLMPDHCPAPSLPVSQPPLSAEESAFQMTLSSKTSLISV